MFFPYSWSPRMIRNFIKTGVYLQRIFVRPERVFQVEDRIITVTPFEHDGKTQKQVNLPVRVYTPHGEGPFPVVIFFHGGGWVICSLDTHDHICRSFCNSAQCVVISVDYRLAPEYRFPTGLEDSYAAALYIHEHATDFRGDPSRICLAGDSAGGNISITITQLCKIRNGPMFNGQLLIYPSTDVRDFHYPSYDGKNLNLNHADGMWFLGHYFNSEAEKNDPRASPIITEDLTGLPPAAIFTGEHDRIRDPGEAYGARLQEQGVKVTIKRYDGVGHGFLSVGAPEIATQCLSACGEWLKEIFKGENVMQTQ